MSDNLRNQELMSIYSKADLNRFPPFSGVLRAAKASNVSLVDAILDLLDNSIEISSEMLIYVTIVDNIIKRLVISDNCPNGFEGLTDDENNPLTIGVTMPNHYTDENINEFGKGLKESTMAIANKLEIITKLPNGKYWKVVLDYEKMNQITDPILAYNHTDSSEIDIETYKNEHPYKTGGSSIYVTNFDKSNEIFDEKKLFDLLTNSLQNKYTKEIKNGKKIVLKINDKKVTIEELDDIFKHPKCIERMIEVDGRIMSTEGTYKTYVHQQKGNDVEFYEVIKNPNNGKHVQFMKKRAITKRIWERDTANFNYDFQIRSTSTKNIPEIPECYNSRMYVSRGNIMKYGSGIFKTKPGYNRSEEGYTNHVRHEMSYKSKALNPLIGINSSKKLDTNKESTLTFHIGYIQNVLKTMLWDKPKSKKDQV